MANHTLNYWQCFGIIVLMVAAWNMVPILADKSCKSYPFGACGGRGQCDQNCKARFPDGQGSCDLGLCSCYSCTKIPPPKKKCIGGIGLCSNVCDENCCNGKCAGKFNEGVGFCNSLGVYRMCTCEYTC
ncbi:unnamed protein product [Lupinus luteus]|uniref:Defensin-like protein n=1 Tax=Lupinus luteus TaxID=3873 RepID=A0AAV1WBB2_LUPLU